VESVISELKTASKRREEESRRISDEVRGLKDLIPKAIEGQKETTDSRLRELNTELKSLKTLMGQRMNPGATTSTNPYSRTSGIGSSAAAATFPANINGSASADTTTPKPASVSNGTSTEAVASLQSRSSTPFSAGAPAGKAAIPAWQMAAANKSTNSVNTTGTEKESSEAS
jgi:peroxin-14